MDFETFKVEHAGQLAAIPAGLWESLYSKLSSETFDAGFYFALIEGPEGHSLRSIEGLTAESQIFLVDHAWTFANEEQAAKDLAQIPNLIDRMEVSLNVLNEHGGIDQSQWEEHEEMLKLIVKQTGCSREEGWAVYKQEHFDLVNTIAKLSYRETDEDRKRREKIESAIAQQAHTSKGPQLSKTDRISRVLAELWKCCQTYQMQYQLPDGTLRAGHIWYIPDEVGLGIKHSDSPNIVMIPFRTINGDGERVTFNLFWPIKDIAAGEFVTRNASPSALEGLSKEVYLTLFKGDMHIRSELEKLWEAQQSVQPIRHANTAASPLTPLENVKVFTNSGLETFQFEEVKDGNHASLLWTIQSPVDFHRAITAIRECYGNVHWIRPAYVLPKELLELYCHVKAIEKDKHFAWACISDTKELPTQSLPTLIRHCDLAMTTSVHQVCGNVALYGGRRFSLEFSVALVSEQQDLHVFLYPTFITMIASKEQTKECWMDPAELHTIASVDSQGNPSPSPAVFVKNFEGLMGGNWENTLASIKSRISGLFLAFRPLPSTAARSLALYTVSFEFHAGSLDPIITDISPDSLLYGLRAFDRDSYVRHFLAAGAGQESCFEKL